MADVTTGHDTEPLSVTTYKDLFVDLFLDVTADEPLAVDNLMQGMLEATEELLIHHVNTAKQFEGLRERLRSAYSVPQLREQ